MEKNASDDLEYYLNISLSDKDFLASIRHWSNLAVGTEGNKIWVKGFKPSQIQSIEVKSIPFKTIYSENNGKLYMIDSLLPDRAVPFLEWLSIDKALAIELPSTNNNYFGITEKISWNIIPSETEKEGEGLLTTIPILNAYIDTAPLIRLEKLRWVIIDDNWVFLKGSPLLPIQGDVYWIQGDFLIPAGYDFDLKALMSVLNSRINLDNDNWLIWQLDNTYFKIRKKDMKPLSLSSFRKTLYLRK